MIESLFFGVLLTIKHRAIGVSLSCSFTVCVCVCIGAKEQRRWEKEKKEHQACPLCPTQLCYSSSGGKTVYCWGQGPRHMFTGFLRRSIVVKTHPKHVTATLKIISNRAPLPRRQMKPILTSFIRKRTFKKPFRAAG